jgi:tetratricopeptide (TPR) repeat protein
MEYVDGEPITAYCRRVGAPLRVRLDLFLQVCDAVEYAHRNLLVHRDLKPSNILVDQSGRVRLLDFGTAEWLDAETRTSPGGGAALAAMTPSYAAPEQWRGEPPTTGTDVFALGVVLCEVLTGAVPYEVPRGRSAQVHLTAFDAGPAKPSALAAAAGSPAGGDLPCPQRLLRGDLDQIVLKAVAVAPDARYRSVDTLAADVRRYLARYPVEASGRAWSYRTRKFISRHRTGVAVAAVLLAAIVAGLAGTAWQARRARAEAARARAVQAFLVSLFRTTDPGAAAQARTARDILEQGAARIDAELAAEPDLQVELWRTVADVQRQLGDYDGAERLLGKAIGVQQRRGKPAEIGLARTRLQLASVLNDHYRTNDAERSVQQAMPVIKARLGERSGEMGDVYELLGSLKYGSGDYAGAEQLRRQALEIYRERFGERSAQVANVENNLAVFYAERGRYPEAEAAGGRAVNIRRALLGEAHPDTLLSMYNLANALYQRGVWVDAAAILEKVLAGQQRALGPAHPHTALTERQVARILTGFGRFDEAAKLLQDSGRITAEAYGPDSAAAGYVMTQQSRLEQLRGRFDEAVRLARQVLESFERDLGPDHVETAWARMNLGNRLIDAGAFDEAERELQRAERTFGAAGGESDPYYAQTLDLRGLLAARRGRPVEARPLFERALGLFGSAEADRAFDAAPSRWHLAAVLDGPGESARRDQLFREALETLRRSLPPAHTQTTDVLVAYGRFLSDRGRAAEAEPLLREAHETRVRTLGEGNILTAEASDALGRSLVSAGRAAEGRPLIEGAAPVLARFPWRSPLGLVAASVPRAR